MKRWLRKIALIICAILFTIAALFSGGWLAGKPGGSAGFLQRHASWEDRATDPAR